MGVEALEVGLNDALNSVPILREPNNSSFRPIGARADMDCGPVLGLARSRSVGLVASR